MFYFLCVYLFCTVLSAQDGNGDPLPETVASCVEEILNESDDLPPLPNQQPLIYKPP